MKQNKQNAEILETVHTGRLKDYLKCKNEKGITLVALIVTIILLVILTAVVIRNITAGDNLIDSTMTAREEYNIKSYRQQIESVVQSVIVRK